MQRRVFLLLGLILALPVLANASTIAPQDGAVVNLLPNTAGQVVNLLISGSDFYTDSNFQMTINGGVGPAPAVEAVFGDTGALISPGTLLNGSVWQNGTGGITGAPNGTTFDSSGLTTGAGFQTPGTAPQSTAGIYIALTVTTVGISGGDYIVSLAGTDLNNGLDPETFEPLPVQLDAQNFTLHVTPEPSSVVLGLFAAAGVAAAVIRRRRRTA